MAGRNRRFGSRRAIAGGAALIVAAGLAPALAPGVSSASSHREAPLTAADPKIDNTDVYAFVSPQNDGTVTLIANWIPFEEPNGGPNFYPFAEDAAYYINIDNNGDGAADLAYRWTFKDHYRNTTQTFLYNTGVVKHLTDPSLNFYQTYNLDLMRDPGTSKQSVTKILANRIAAPSRVGPVSMPNYGQLRKEAVVDFGSGIGKGSQTFAGQSDDSFFLDLRVFDLLYGPKPLPGCATGHDCRMTETGQDTLAGYNVNTIALKVPAQKLALRGSVKRNPNIGVWSTTDRRSMRVLGTGTSTESGKFVQVSRLGNPLVNEVVVPLAYKDAFNAIPPSADHTVKPVVNKVLHPIVPQLVEALYGLPAPKGARKDLFEVFLTGVCKSCGPIGSALGANLNSQKTNADVHPARFVPAEELRLNMGIEAAAKPSRLGVLGGDLAGFPNGRRLTDDVVDIELQALEGALPPYGNNVSALGDGVNRNDKPFQAVFPYTALPNTVAVNRTLNH